MTSFIMRQDLEATIGSLSWKNKKAIREYNTHNVRDDLIEVRPVPRPSLYDAGCCFDLQSLAVALGRKNVNLLAEQLRHGQVPIRYNPETGKPEVFCWDKTVWEIDAVVPKA